MKKYDYRTVEIRIPRQHQANQLIQFLHQQKVKMKNVQHTEKEVIFEIARYHVPIIRKARRKYKLKVKIEYLYNSRILQKNSWTFIGMLLLIVIPIFCSQVVWKVDVQAGTPELRVAVEKVIDDKLTLLNRPILKRELPSDFEIRQQIMEQLRDLSWVHIIKTGSNIIIVPQQAPINHDRLQKSEQLHHLVASKSGVITHFDIKSGERKISPNSTVYKDEQLVSGIILAGDEPVAIGAEGEVFADYWLETEFTIPKKIQYIAMDGMVWKIDFKFNEKKESEPSFQKINLPKWLSKFIEIQRIQNYTIVTQELSEKQIESFIMPLLHEKILKSLPSKTIIKKENILHATFDGDKVKGKVLYLINENIAKPIPIKQEELKEKIEQEN